MVVDDFIRSKFVYMHETIETLLTPDYMISGLEVTNHLVGDCDDISTLHAAILTCMDVKVRFVAIRSTYEDQNFDHVYIEAYDGKNGKNGKDWQLFDATVQRGTVIESFARINMNI